METSLAKLQIEHDWLVAEKQQLQERLNAHESEAQGKAAAREAELESSLTEAQTKLAERESELAALRDKLNGKSANSDTGAESVRGDDPFGGAESKHSDAQSCSDNTDSLPILPNANELDDLKSIKGVGAKIEQKLNMLGVKSFRSLLELDEDDYRRAEEHIPNLQGRMQRDGWIEQARTLHLEKYNEEL